MRLNKYDEIIKACTWLLHNLPQAKECKDYLDSRLPQKYQDKFEFGYFPNIENFKSISSIIDIKDLIDLKLVYETNLSGIKSVNPVLKNHNLIMPYKNLYGDTIAIVGRSIKNNYQSLNISKYKNTSFSKSHNLFGLDKAKSSILKFDSVYIVEGQFDVIKAHSKGIKNIVALGSSSMSSYQVSILKRYTKNFHLLLDNDDAGKEGRNLIKNKFSQYKINISNLYVPKLYKDIDEYLTNLQLDEEILFDELE